MRRGPKADDLWAEPNESVVVIRRLVAKCDVDSHGKWVYEIGKTCALVFALQKPPARLELRPRVPIVRQTSLG